jgi:microcompartment protein CcmK/EutM
MILGRIAGSITSTIHHPSMHGHKILIVDRLDRAGEPTGAYLVALDRVGAGAGEKVLVLDEGNGARQILGSENAPVRSVIVGIVDAVDP